VVGALTRERPNDQLGGLRNALDVRGAPAVEEAARELPRTDDALQLVDELFAIGALPTERRLSVSDQLAGHLARVTRADDEGHADGASIRGHDTRRRVAPSARCFSYPSALTLCFVLPLKWCKRVRRVNKLEKRARRGDGSSGGERRSPLLDDVLLWR